MYFVMNVKFLLLYQVSSYSTQLMCIPKEIFIAKQNLVLLCVCYILCALEV